MAEQTLLRALLSDEWADLVRGRLQPSDFPDANAARLVEEILPLVDGKYPPREAVALLADASLADYANGVLLAAEEEPLSEAIIQGCLHALGERRRRENLRQTAAEIRGAEGNGADDDEKLRRWYSQMRALKTPRTAEDQET